MHTWLTTRRLMCSLLCSSSPAGFALAFSSAMLMVCDKSRICAKKPLRKPERYKFFKNFENFDNSKNTISTRRNPAQAFKHTQKIKVDVCSHKEVFISHHWLFSWYVYVEYTGSKKNSRISLLTPLQIVLLGQNLIICLNGWLQ